MQRTCLTILAVVVVCGVTQGNAQAQSLEGTWQLEEMGGNEYGRSRVNPRGLWILGESHYSYTLVAGPAEREPLGSLQTPGQPTDAERIAFAQHVGPFLLAQAGTYEVNGTTLTYHPMVSRVEGPNFPGEPMLELQFEGNDTVVLTAANGAEFRFTRLE